MCAVSVYISLSSLSLSCLFIYFWLWVCCADDLSRIHQEIGLPGCSPSLVPPALRDCMTLSGLTLCGRNGPAGCQSTVFSTLGQNYSQVCGQLRGYQRGTPDAFFQPYEHSQNKSFEFHPSSVTVPQTPR